MDADLIDDIAYIRLSSGVMTADLRSEPSIIRSLAQSKSSFAIIGLDCFAACTAAYKRAILVTLSIRKRIVPCLVNQIL